MNDLKEKPGIENRSWLYRKGPELIGVALVVTLVGFFLLWPAFQNVRDSLDVGSWNQTEAVVTRSYMSESNNGSGRIRRSYRFNYEYEVDGQTFTGWRYSLAFPSGSGRAAIDLYDKGQTIDIYYDPDAPARSVVNRNASAWWNYLVLGVSSFLAIFGFSMRFGKRST